MQSSPRTLDPFQVTRLSPGSVPSMQPGRIARVDELTPRNGAIGDQGGYSPMNLSTLSTKKVVNSAGASPRMELPAILASPPMNKSHELSPVAADVADVFRAQVLAECAVRSSVDSSSGLQKQALFQMPPPFESPSHITYEEDHQPSDYVAQAFVAQVFAECEKANKDQLEDKERESPVEMVVEAAPAAVMAAEEESVVVPPTLVDVVQEEEKLLSTEPTFEQNDANNVSSPSKAADSKDTSTIVQPEIVDENGGVASIKAETPSPLVECDLEQTPVPESVKIEQEENIVEAIISPSNQESPAVLSEEVVVAVAADEVIALVAADEVTVPVSEVTVPAPAEPVPESSDQVVIDLVEPAVSVAEQPEASPLVEVSPLAVENVVEERSSDNPMVESVAAVLDSIEASSVPAVTADFIDDTVAIARPIAYVKAEQDIDDVPTGVPTGGRPQSAEEALPFAGESTAKKEQKVRRLKCFCF